MDLFLEICKSSEQANWCDSIYCTTCGHINFKYLFLLISRDDYESGTILINHNHTKILKDDGELRSSVKSEVKKHLRQFQLSNENQIKLADLISDTNLKKVHKKVNTEKWIKALGIILYHTQENKDASQILTEVLLPQLRQIISEDNFLFNLETNLDEKLTWKSLKYIELKLKDEDE